jgi:hypothetical protein
MNKIMSYSSQDIDKVFVLLDKLKISGVESAHCIVGITKILSSPTANNQKELSPEGEIRK